MIGVPPLLFIYNNNDTYLGGDKKIQGRSGHPYIFLMLFQICIHIIVAIISEIIFIDTCML